MNQSQIIQAITLLFPKANWSRDYTLAIDGSGNATIAVWNVSVGTQPTGDQLNTALAALQLGQTQTAQVAVLTAASNLAQSTFTNSALGSVYTYPSAPTDQANLTACVTYSLFPSNPSTWTCLFYCTSTTGAAGFVPHTAAQIQQVGQDAMASIMAAKSKLANLEGQVAAATTIAAVQQIVWS